MTAYQTTPLAVDLYSRYMADMFDEKKIIGVPTAFQKFFGRPETGAVTRFSPDAGDVDIDIIRGSEKIGALIPRGIGGRNLDGKNTAAQKFSNFNRVYPLGELEGNIDSNQLTKRLAGDTPYMSRTRMERLRILGNEHHDEHIRRFVRMFEVLAAQSVLTGKMDTIIGTTDTSLQFDFRRKSTHTFQVPITWSNSAADILKDIDDAWELGREDAHVSYDMIVMGETAVAAFIADEDVRTKADNRRFELIQVSNTAPVPQKYTPFIEGGMTARGRLVTPRGHEMWIFSYSDIYTDSGGSAVKYMSNNHVLVCYSGARCDRFFGPPDRLPMTPQQSQAYREYFGFNPDAVPMPPNIKATGATVFPGMFYRDAYLSPDAKSITCRTQCAPIYATTQTDAFVYMEVIF